MLGGIRPGPNSSKSRWMPWLTGTGYGSLPEDSPAAGLDSALFYNPDGIDPHIPLRRMDYMLDVVSCLAQSQCNPNTKWTPFTSQRLFKASPTSVNTA